MLLPCDANGVVLAPFFCHDAISTAMKTALQQCSLPPILVGDVQSPAFFNRKAPALAPCVENAHLIALTRESGDRVFAALVGGA